MNQTDKICTYLNLGEVVRSESAKRNGISNLPTAEHLENMKALGINVFDKIREHFGCPIGLSSGYRSEALNSAIKGSSKTSQHCKGEAFDIDAQIHGKITNKAIFDYIRQSLDFDQLIWEFGTNQEPDWVHVSYKKNGGNRKSILKAIKVNGESKYESWK
jgi:hypothetical protein